MQLRLVGRNFYIVNKKPQSVAKIESTGTTIKIMNVEGNIVEQGQIDLQHHLYACLFCKQLRNITFIIKGKRIYSTSLIMGEGSQFNDVLQLIEKAYPELEISEQNVKINGYAASLVEKLQEGIAVTIMDTKEENVVKCCSVCGMQCDPNLPYCMECGASV